MMNSSAENDEQNPAEPVPDVTTIAEPPQPPDPSPVEEPIGGRNISLQNHNGMTQVARLVMGLFQCRTTVGVVPSHTAGMSGPDTDQATMIEIDSTELIQTSSADFGKDRVDEVDKIDTAMDEVMDKVDTVDSVIDKVVDKVMEKVGKVDRFSQTFVKYAKNLSNRRLIEILNTWVDHENNNLIFYCTSEELLRSFEDGFTPQS